MTQASAPEGGRIFREEVQANLSGIDWTRRGDTFLRLIGESARECGPYETVTFGGQLYSTEEKVTPHGHVTATSEDIDHKLLLQQANGRMRATVSSPADDISPKRWRQILASAVQKYASARPILFSCWIIENARALAVPGRALVSSSGSPVCCEASSEPFVYCQPALTPLRAGGQPHVTYPTRVSCSSEGADFQEARERFVERVSALCQAASILTASSWCVVVDPVQGAECPREAVFDDQNALLAEGERAGLPPAPEPYRAEPVVYLSEFLQDDDELRGLCGSFLHAVQLAPLSPSAGGLLLVAIIEALGERHTSKLPGGADREGGGAVKAFEAGLAYAGALGEDFNNLKRAYGHRSLTAHAAVMHGGEPYGVEFSRMQALSKTSAIRFSLGIVPRLQYVCNQGIRQALREFMLERCSSDDSRWAEAFSLVSPGVIVA